MIAVRQNVRVSDAITTIALDLARFRINIDIETEARPSSISFSNFGVLTQRFITHFPLVHMKCMHSCLYQNQWYVPDEFRVWAYPIQHPDKSGGTVPSMTISS